MIAQFRPRVNDCTWMNSRCELYRGRRELGNDLLKCFRRILHPNYCCSDLFGEIGRHNHGSGARFAKLCEVTRIVEKRDLMDGRFCQRRCARDSRFRITLEFSAGQFRDLFQSERHSSLLNCRGAYAKRLLVQLGLEGRAEEAGAPGNRLLSVRAQSRNLQMTLIKLEMSRLRST